MIWLYLVSAVAVILAIVLSAMENMVPNRCGECGYPNPARRNKCPKCRALILSKKQLRSIKIEEDRTRMEERRIILEACKTQSPPSTTGLATFSALLIIAGILVLLVSWSMKTTVSTPSSDFGGVHIEGTTVNNFGLMADRQIGVIIGFGILFIGVALAILDASQRKKLPDSTVVNTPSAAAEIARFAELKEQGVISEDEFQAKKRQLLGI